MNSHKPLPSEIKINLPPGLLEEACQEYHINLSKNQLKEIEKDCEKKFKLYCEKCRKSGNYDKATGYPIPDPE